MGTSLDADFISSVNSLSQELQLLGVDDNIPTTTMYIACQSLLRTAWNLVQFIHCDSVASAETIFSQEHERKLRDELQQTQTEVQRCKRSLEDKENEIKSRDLAVRQLRLGFKRQQNENDELRLKVKNLEIKIENSHELHKKKISAQAVTCDKLRDQLRSKIGLGRTLKSQTETFADDIKRLSISKNFKRTQEDNLHGAQQAILQLTESNQTLVTENLWMRDTFARLFKQLNDIRLRGLAVLELFGISDLPRPSDETEYPDSVFSQPLSVAVEKLRIVSQAQVDAIIDILRLIAESISAGT